MSTQAEHANSTEKHADLELNPGPSCCEVTGLTTVPKCRHGGNYQIYNTYFKTQLSGRSALIRASFSNSSNKCVERFSAVCLATVGCNGTQSSE